MEHAVELLLLKDQQVIEAFLPHAPHEALADRIGSGCMIRRFQDLDAAGCGHARETGPKFVVVIANQVLGCLSIRGGFSQLLPDPRIGRRPGHAYVDDLP
jgi:hypothetical protein